MIDAKDLMLGNWVRTNFERDKKFIEIGVVDFKEDYFHLYEPIPLTEDILVKNCGAKEIYKSKYSHILELENYPEIQFKNINNTGFKVIFKDIYLENIEYLHELQRLYKNFTKQELEVKL